MKAISIHQPFASLIVDGPEYIPAGMPRKRVENRTWASPFVGVPILIHASKTTIRLDSLGWSQRLRDRMPMGALVGVAVISACIRYEPGYFDLVGKRPMNGIDLSHLAWVNGHFHAEGPVCWVLESVSRFPNPIPYKGAQGFFDVPNHLVMEQIGAAIQVKPNDVGVFK